MKENTRQLTFSSSANKSPIYGYIWESSKNTEPLGVLQLVHGFAEHSRRYAAFARLMASKGFVVASHDHLGHGKSANGNFGFVANEGGHKFLAKDTHQFTNILNSDYDLPLVLLGIGSGSLIARYVCGNFGKDYAAAILLGTSGKAAGMYFKIKEKLAEKDAVWLDKIWHKYNNRHFRKSVYGESWLTRSIPDVAAFEADPLCGFSLTYSAWRDILHLNKIVNSRAAFENMPKDLPMLLISGLDDPMGSFGRGVIKVYERLVMNHSPFVDIKLYEECRHELLFELNKDEIYDDILEWILKVLP